MHRAWTKEKYQYWVQEVKKDENICPPCPCCGGFVRSYPSTLGYWRFWCVDDGCQWSYPNE